MIKNKTLREHLRQKRSKSIVSGPLTRSRGEWYTRMVKKYESSSPRTPLVLTCTRRHPRLPLSLSLLSMLAGEINEKRGLVHLLRFAEACLQHKKRTFDRCCSLLEYFAVLVSIALQYRVGILCFAHIVLCITLRNTVL